MKEEGTDVWRPVKGEYLGDSKYRIVSINSSPEDEHWEFETGDIVKCEKKDYPDGTRIVIVGKYVV